MSLIPWLNANTHRTPHLWPWCGGMLLIGVSLFLCWGGQPRPAHCQKSVQDTDLIGAHRCRGCHESAYQTWQASAHAKTFSRLSQQDRQNSSCLSCHTTGTAPHLQGVQCESCHGGGRYYSIPEVMVDRTLARAVGLKVQRGVSGCASCHQSSSVKLRKFHYSSMWKKIAHPSPQKP